MKDEIIIRINVRKVVYFGVQKLLGIMMLVLSAFILFANDMEATPLLLTVPMGLYLFFSKRKLIRF